MTRIVDKYVRLAVRKALGRALTKVVREAGKKVASKM